MHQTESVDSGQFAFTAGRSGPHTVCFWTPQFELSTVFPVEFEWKSGVAAKDWSDVAKKGKVNVCVEIPLTPFFFFCFVLFCDLFFVVCCFLWIWSCGCSCFCMNCGVLYVNDVDLEWVYGINPTNTWALSMDLDFLTFGQWRS